MAKTKPTKKPVKPSESKASPIQHATLPPELLEQIEAAYETVGSYLGTTLKQFEIRFMRWYLAFRFRTSFHGDQAAARDALVFLVS